MKKGSTKMYDVSDTLQELVENQSKINMIYQKRNIIYERTLIPITKNNDFGITLYRHTKQTYEIINGPNGKVYRLIDRKEMSQTSTISEKIYKLLKSLETSGYVIGDSSNWEVI